MPPSLYVGHTLIPARADLDAQPWWAQGPTLAMGINAVGVDIPATTVTLQAPQSTGSAAPAGMVFQTAHVGAHGAVLQTLENILTLGDRLVTLLASASFVIGTTTLAATSASLGGSLATATTIRTGQGVPAGVLAIHGSNYVGAGPADLDATFERGLVYSSAFGGLSAGFVGCRAGGTFLNPTASDATGSLVILNGDGYDGAAWTSGGALGISPIGLWTQADHGTNFGISLIAAGTVGTVSMLSLDGAGLHILQHHGNTGGNLGVGTLAVAGQGIRLTGTQTTRVDQYGMIAVPTFNQQATVSGLVYYSSGIAAAAAFVMPLACGYYAADWSALAGGAVITTQCGVYVEAQTRGVTNWAIYTVGATRSRFGGTVGIMGDAAPGQGIRLVGTLDTRTDQYGALLATTFNQQATVSGMVYYSQGATVAAAFVLPLGVSYYADDWVLGAGSTITKQVGVFVAPQTKGATNYGIETHGVLVIGADAAAIAATGTDLLFSGVTQATVGAAGAAADLPAHPLGYWVGYKGATKIALPYYNA